MVRVKVLTHGLALFGAFFKDFTMVDGGNES
jgi:hypothetical protein